MTRLHIQKNRVKKFAIINLKSLIWVAKYTNELQCLYSLSLIGNIKANKTYPQQQHIHKKHISASLEKIKKAQNNAKILHIRLFIHVACPNIAHTQRKIDLSRGLVQFVFCSFSYRFKSDLFSFFLFDSGAFWINVVSDSSSKISSGSQIELTIWTTFFWEISHFSSNSFSRILW